MQVPNVDWAEGCTAKSMDQLRVWRDTIWTKTLDYIRSELATGRCIDLFLSYFFPQQIEPSAIIETKKLGVPCVNFFCDNVREFASVPEEFKCFDLNWVPEYEAVPMYEAAKLPCLNAPMPCWVAPELRTVPEFEKEPPTFVGSADVLRRKLFSEAISRGADFILRGPGWDDERVGRANLTGRSWIATARNQFQIVRKDGVAALARKFHNRLFSAKNQNISSTAVRPAVWGDEYFRILREATVTIGVNRVPSLRRSNRRPLIYSRLRDIEAPMLGACYLTEYTDGLAQLYDLGREVETYKSAEELCAKLDELLAAHGKRESMRQLAQRRALREHSLPKSLNKICHHLGLVRA